MKVIGKQSDLLRGLTAVSHAVSNRSTLPILANILFATDAGRLKLSATNLELGITCWVDVEVLEEGATTVPAKLITEFVKSLPAALVEVTVSTDTQTMNVKSQRSSANIKGMDSAEFPQIPCLDGTPIAFEAALFKEVVDQVAFAAADDDSRPVLTGVLVQMGDEKITFAAADAFRLAVREVDVPDDDHPRGDILVPARTLTELARILPDDQQIEMVVPANRSQVVFRTPSLVLVSRLIEGAFPNFRTIIPPSATTCMVADTKELAGALKSVALFAQDSSNIARVKIEPAGEGQESGVITIEATAEDVGDNVSTVNASVDGPVLQVIFNVKYMADVLSAIHTPEVQIEGTSATKPGVIRPAGQANCVYVIMPMHINR
jgi:DNA polymerase III subunit beta